jgi:hypothetical protein
MSNIKKQPAGKTAPGNNSKQTPQANKLPWPQNIEDLEKNWITGQQLMAWLCITKAHLKRWRTQGVLGYTSLGGILLYSRQWIQEMLEKNWVVKCPK